MSEISTIIRVKDGFSKTLKQFSRALDSVEKSLNKTQTKLGKPVDMTAFSKMRSQIIQANTSLSQLGARLDRATSSQNRHAASARNNAGAVSTLTRNVKNLVAAYAGFEGVKGSLNMADEYANVSSRLNLMNDGLITTAELENKIRDAAERTRSSFTTTADAVSKMGIQAQEAFNNSSDVVNFIEQINKHMVVAGINTQTAENAMIQLTQAMGSGLLRGEELRSIMEGMPTVAKAIEKYFHAGIGVKQDKRILKEIAEDNLVTAEIVKNAIFSYADEINNKFAKMKYRFADVWNLFKNEANKALVPVFNKLTDISNSQGFQNFARVAGAAVGFLGNQIVKVIDVAKGLYNFIANNWGIIRPIVMSIAAAYLVLGAAALIARAKIIAQGIAATISGIQYQIALFKMMAAQHGLNAALAACPLTWFIYLIIAVIAAFYLAIAVVNKFCGTTLSATGMIAGAFMWLGALIANIFIGIWNILSGIVQAVVNAWIWCADNISAVFHNIGVWWSNLWIDAKIGFYSFINEVLSKLASLAKKIQPIADLLDIDLSGLTNSVGDKISNLEGSKKEYKGYTAFKDINWETTDFFNLGDAYDKGYKWGENLANEVSDFFSIDEITKSLGIEDLTNLADSAAKPLTSAELKDNASNPALRGTNGDYGKNALDRIADNTDKLVDNTAKDEYLKVMRELGTRESVTRFTTNNYTAMQTNNMKKTVEGDDSFNFSKLAKALRDAFNTSAEGVY